MDAQSCIQYASRPNTAALDAERKVWSWSIQISRCGSTPRGGQCHLPTWRLYSQEVKTKHEHGCDVDTTSSNVLTGNVLAGMVLAGDLLAGISLAGDVLAGKVLTGNVPTGNILAGKALTGILPAGILLAGILLAGDVLAAKVLAGNVLTSNVERFASAWRWWRMDRGDLSTRARSHTEHAPVGLVHRAR